MRRRFFAPLRRLNRVALLAWGLAASTALAVAVSLGGFLVEPATSTAADCHNFDGNQAGCTSQMSCNWDTFSCSTYDGNQASCQADTQCSWNSGSDCSAFSGDILSCQSAGGCTYNASTCSSMSDQGSCAGANCTWSGSDCHVSDNTDQNTCEINAGCSWDGGSLTCSGFYNASCTGDNASCTGTYNANTCNGSYALGTCSGTYTELLTQCATLSSPGTYVLGSDLGGGGDCLVVAASNVVIDGNSHSIFGNIVSAGYAYVVQNVTVNGVISSDGLAPNDPNTEPGVGGGTITLNSVALAGSVHANGSSGTVGGNGGAVLATNSSLGLSGGADVVRVVPGAGSPAGEPGYINFTNVILNDQSGHFFSGINASVSGAASYTQFADKWIAYGGVLSYLSQAVLPGNVDTCGYAFLSGTYSLTQDVSAAGVCFYVSAAGVTINGGTHSITNSNGGDSTAVRGVPGSDLTLTNATVFGKLDFTGEAVTSGQGGGGGAVGLDNVYLHGRVLTLGGATSDGVSAGGPGGAVLVRNSTISSTAGPLIDVRGGDGASSGGSGSVSFPDLDVNLVDSHGSVQVIASIASGSDFTHLGGQWFYEGGAVAYDAGYLAPGNVSSCGTIAAPGTYTLTQNVGLSDATPCFHILGGNPTINGAGHTIGGTLGIEGSATQDGQNGYSFNLADVVVSGNVYADGFSSGGGGGTGATLSFASTTIAGVLRADGANSSGGTVSITGGSSVGAVSLVGSGGGGTGGHFSAADSTLRLDASHQIDVTGTGGASPGSVSLGNITLRNDPSSVVVADFSASGSGLHFLGSAGSDFWYVDGLVTNQGNFPPLLSSAELHGDVLTLHYSASVSGVNPTSLALYSDGQLVTPNSSVFVGSGSDIILQMGAGANAASGVLTVSYGSNFATSINGDSLAVTGFSVSRAAATRYFYGAVNSNWATLGNWWRDEAHTQPAPDLPLPGDTVYFLSSVSQNTGDPASVYQAIFPSLANNGIAIAVSGSADFSGGAVNSGTVTGNATFGDTSRNDGTVDGDATFSGASHNEGTVTGAATFNGSSYNGSLVHTAATFNGSSYNAGRVDGAAFFNGSSGNDAGSVGGSADVYYPVPRPLGGTVEHGITYHGYDETPPAVSIAAPLDGASILSWLPSVSWDDATACAYSFGLASFVGVDCGASGADIPSPGVGSHQLVVRGEDAAGNRGYATSSFSVAAPASAAATGDSSSSASTGGGNNGRSAGGSTSRRRSGSSGSSAAGGGGGTSASGSNGAAASSSPAAPVFLRDLKFKDVAADVRALQRYLNAHGFAVAAAGPGSAGAETTYFGAATRAALARFQLAHAISPALGFFGPVTRAFVNEHP